MVGYYTIVVRSKDGELAYMRSGDLETTSGRVLRIMKMDGFVERGAQIKIYTTPREHTIGKESDIDKYC